MPVFLGNANAADQFKCSLCGEVFARMLIEEHHLIKRQKGGRDTPENLLRLDSNCHTAIHQIEAALKNPKRGAISDLASLLFPKSMLTQKRLLECAAIAASGIDHTQKSNTSKYDDYSIFDTEDLVTLPPARVSPAVQGMVKTVARDMRNPQTGRSLGIGKYIEGLIMQDLRRKGFKV